MLTAGLSSERAGDLLNGALKVIGPSILIL